MQSPDKKIVKDFPSGGNFVSVSCPLSDELESSDPYVRDTAKLKLLMVDAAREIRTSLSKQEPSTSTHPEEKSPPKRSSDETVAVFQNNLYNDNLIHKATVVTLAKVLREEIDSLKESSHVSATAYENRLHEMTIIRQESDVKLNAAQETISSLERMLSQSIGDDASQPLHDNNADSVAGHQVSSSSGGVDVDDDDDVGSKSDQMANDDNKNSNHHSDAISTSSSTPTVSAGSTGTNTTQSTSISTSSSRQLQAAAGNIIVTNLSKILHDKAFLLTQVTQLKSSSAIITHELNDLRIMMMKKDEAIQELRDDLAVARQVQADRDVAVKTAADEAMMMRFEQQAATIDEMNTKSQIDRSKYEESESLLQGQIDSLSLGIAAAEESKFALEQKIAHSQQELDTIKAEKSAVEERLLSCGSSKEESEVMKKKVSDLLGALIAIQETAASLNTQLHEARAREDKLKADHVVDIDRVRHATIDSGAAERSMITLNFEKLRDRLDAAKQAEQEAVEAMKGMDIELQQTDTKFRESSFERDTLKSEVDSANSHIANLTQLLGLAETTLTSTSESAHSNLNDKSSLFQLWKALETARSENGKIRTDYRELLKRASTREPRALVINVAAQEVVQEGKSDPSAAGAKKVVPRQIHRKLRSTSNAYSLSSSDNIEGISIIDNDAPNLNTTPAAFSSSSSSSTPILTSPASSRPIEPSPLAKPVPTVDYTPIIAEMEHRLNSISQEKTTAQSECESLRAQLSSKQTEVNSLTEHAALLRETINKDRQNFMTANEAYRQSVTKIMEDRYEEEEAARKALEDEIESLKEKEVRLKQQMKRMVMNDEDDGSAGRITIPVDTSSKDTANAAVLMEAERKVVEMQDEVAKSNEEKDQCMDELSQLATAMQDMQEANDGLASQVEDLQAKLDQCQAIIAANEAAAVEAAALVAENEEEDSPVQADSEPTQAETEVAVVVVTPTVAFFAPEPVKQVQIQDPVIQRDHDDADAEPDDDDDDDLTNDGEEDDDNDDDDASNNKQMQVAEEKIKVTDNNNDDDDRLPR